MVREERIRERDACSRVPAKGFLPCHGDETNHRGIVPPTPSLKQLSTCGLRHVMPQIGTIAIEIEPRLRFNNGHFLGKSLLASPKN